MTEVLLLISVLFLIYFKFRINGLAERIDTLENRFDSHIRRSDSKPSNNGDHWYYLKQLLDSQKE